jgi:hypothetical protein
MVLSSEMVVDKSQTSQGPGQKKYYLSENETFSRS